MSPTHRGARWEQIRLAKLARSLPFIDRPLEEVRTADVAGWRDSAIAGGLAPATVRRELVLLRGVFEQARREWGWLRDNPMSGMRWPSAGRPRDRRITDDELDRLLLAMDYERGTRPTRRSHQVAIALLLAIETAMRAGELCGLTWPDVDRAGRCVTLPRTKNGERRRVPLSRAALELLDLLPDGPSVLGLTPAALDVAFRRARDAAGIIDLHWHDSRHEAITRLARRLDVLDLARMIGHRDLKSLQVYYNATPAEIAARLDG